MAPEQHRLSTRLRRAPTRYVPVAPLASGGMAEVWRADALFEDGGSHPVAIKRVLPALAHEDLFRSMFLDEARLGMLLRHRNIVRVYDAREIAGVLIMVMELVDGMSLRALLEAAHARQAQMPVPVALHVLRELGRALAYTHAAVDQAGQHLGIIHRDVSPHNVLLSRSGTVKLTDFGLANASVHETARSTDLVGGKLGYLAPEVVLRQPAGPAIDVFAAGIVLWEMLAGRALFSADDDAETVRNVVRLDIPRLSTLNPRVPPEVDDLAARLLDRRMDRRLSSAAMLVEELDRIVPDVDPRVGARDVALVVGLHLAEASRAKPAATPGVAELLAQELDVFVRQTTGLDYDIGAEPLDPADFQMPSGVRSLPTK